MNDIGKVGPRGPAALLRTPFARPRGFAILLVAAAASLVLFNRFPGIDLAASRWFFHATSCATDAVGARECGRFPARSIQGLNELRQFLQILPFVVAVGIGLRMLVQLAEGARLASGPILAASAVFWTYVLSSGLLVNVILKEFWGRPRPSQTIFFGGDFPFVRAGEISQHCASNCSFVSGEAASSFWLLCVPALLPARWRRLGYVAAGAVAAITAGMRVAFGAHFLSDVILAGFFTLLIFSLLAITASRLSTRESLV